MTIAFFIFYVYGNEEYRKEKERQEPCEDAVSQKDIYFKLTNGAQLSVFERREKMLKKLRKWLFRLNIKRTRKLCSKYNDCNDCPYGMEIKKDCYLCEYYESKVCENCKDKNCYMNAFTKSYYPEEEHIAECKLTMWDKGVDRYPYEYEELL